MNVYALLEPATPVVVVFRRTEQGFVRDDYHGLEAVVPMPELEIHLPLAEVFEGVQFNPEWVEEA